MTEKNPHIREFAQTPKISTMSRFFEVQAKLTGNLAKFSWVLLFFNFMSDKEESPDKSDKKEAIQKNRTKRIHSDVVQRLLQRVIDVPIHSV